MTYAADGHVSERVIIRAVVALRSESPLYPVASDAFVEGHTVVIQEVGGASTAGVCICRLRNHSFAFHRRNSGICHRYEHIEHLAEGPVERFHGLGHAVLHLRHVARLMHRQHLLPRNRLGIVGRRNGKQVHTLGRPCDGAVRRIPAVQHDRHPLSARTACLITRSTLHIRTHGLEVVPVNPCKRVVSLGVDNPVVFCIDAVPLKPPRVVACHIKLRRCSYRKRQHVYYCQKSFHLRFINMPQIQS